MGGGAFQKGVDHISRCWYALAQLAGANQFLLATGKNRNRVCKNRNRNCPQLQPVD
jgi:hypothetical protein